MLHPKALALSLSLSVAWLQAQTKDLYDTSVVRSFYVTFAQPNWWSLLVQNKASRTPIRADMSVDGKVYRDVGVRFKGNTSYSYNSASQKKPFAIDMDAFVPGQDLLGYQNLNLQNAYKDPTFIREVLAYDLMRPYMPSLGCNFVKLYLNNEYWGIYVNVQQLDKRFLRDWFPDDEGNLYRGDAPQRNSRPTLTYLGTNWTSYAAIYDYKTENHPTPWQDLIKVCFTLNNYPLAQLPVEWPKVFDEDNALWYIALNNILSNTDSYLGTGNDYYVYHDELHGRFKIMPWDLNTVFGGYDWRNLLGAQGLKVMSPYYAGAAVDPRPLITQMLAVPRWKERYLAHFRTVLAEVFSWNQIAPLADRYFKLIEPDVVADTKKLYATQLFYDSMTKDVVVRDDFGSYTIPGLQSFVDTKRNYLLTHPDIAKAAPVVSELGHAPSLPTSTQTVFVTARLSSNSSKATVFWRTSGVFREAPMLDDGNHGDGAANDGVFGGAIPPQPPGAGVDYYVGAETAQGVMTFLPSKAAHAPGRYRVLWSQTTAAVRINEFVAKNDTGIQDEQGEREDWIELWNSSQQQVDLSGMFLTDRPDQPTQWAFPPNTKLNPGAFLLVWCDEQGSQGPLHCSFKLSASGEDLALYDRDGRTLLDFVSFGPQQADVATGRLFDGGVPWVTFESPTPRAANAPSGCGVRAYSALEVLRHPARLSVSGAPKIGSQVSLDMTRGLPNGVFVVLFASGDGYLPVFPSFVLLTRPPFLIDAVLADGNGAARVGLGLPDDPSLVGGRLYLQLLAVDLVALVGSNAVEMGVCAK